MFGHSPLLMKIQQAFAPKAPPMQTPPYVPQQVAQPQQPQQQGQGGDLLSTLLGNDTDHSGLLSKIASIALKFGGM